jgi:hypothetical protein
VQRSEAVGWSGFLTTIGAGIEVCGLGLTGVALWDRGERHNAPPGRLRRASRWIDDRIRARLGRPRPQFIEPQPARVTITTGGVWPRARPGEIADDAPVDDKVAWLTRYVELLDRDIDAMIGEFHKLPDQVRSEFKATTKALEQRLARQKDEFSEEMIADLGSAWFGLALAIVGVCLGLAGYWLS